MTLHKLLAKQLLRLGLSDEKMPETSEQWHEFITRVNNSYSDTDQEREVLARSMEISSREMQELNQRLTDAQRIARLGYWYRDLEKDEANWSRQIYEMFELDISQPAPKFANVLAIIQEDDRKKMDVLMKKLIENGEGFETEMRMRNVNNEGDYKWYNVIAQAVIEPGKPITKMFGTAMDISRRKAIEDEVTSLHQQLVSSARRAGMADVATSILHNVGNILNSANVSLGVIQEINTNNDFVKLEVIAQMLEAHEADLAAYITTDEKGKLLLPYLLELTKKMAVSVHTFQAEILNLREHVNHIKDITAMQKTLSGITGLMEKVFLTEQIDVAIKMCGNIFEKYNIKLVKDIKENIFISTDKTKLLQILVNLLQNAKDALKDLDYKREKLITIVIAHQQDDEFLSIAIADNGVGIKQENLNSIFGFGFTTKIDGHGFGLHSSALAAKELGGSLMVTSDGENQGASFTLLLPMLCPVRSIEDDAEPRSTHNSY